MRRILTAVLACVVLALGIREARAQESAHATPVVVPKGAEEVWQLEVKRRALLIAGDIDGLEALCADGLTYSHTNGMVDTRKSYFKALRSGVRYVRMDLENVNIAPYDSTVVITGLAHVAVKSPNGAQGFRARFTGVWAKQNGQWRFAAWQTTRMPD